jgi:hypothetical protein
VELCHVRLSTVRRTKELTSEARASVRERWIRGRTWASWAERWAAAAAAPIGSAHVEREGEGGGVEWAAAG